MLMLLALLNLAFQSMFVSTASMNIIMFFYEVPVLFLDWLSQSLRWHITYRVVANPNQQRHNDLHYKFLV